MAIPAERVPENIPGLYYVDKTCIYCALCVETSPEVFRCVEGKGWAAIFRQPGTHSEVASANRALNLCPTASIGIERAPQQINLKRAVIGFAFLVAAYIFFLVGRSHAAH